MINFSLRSNDEEIMDDLNFEGEVLGQTLRELEFINKWLGGNAVTISALDKVIQSCKANPVKIADLGCGSAEMLKIISDRYPNINLKLTGIDANDYVVNHARNNCVNYKNIEIFKHDIFSEEFRNMNFDIMLCTLFLHHFTNDQLTELFRQMSGQVSTAVIVNDIHRHPLAYYSIKGLTSLFSKSYMVKYDAALSVLRAFKKNELSMLLQNSGFSAVSIKWKWAFRYQVILYK
ncbi:MAG: methyltransferase domain-containing protein [Cytophagaceae bacterium]